MGSHLGLLRLFDQGQRLINGALGTIKPLLKGTPLLLELANSPEIYEPPLRSSLVPRTVMVGWMRKAKAAHELAAQKTERAEAHSMESHWYCPFV